MVVKLLHANMIVDPRIIFDDHDDHRFRGYNFSFVVKERTLTVTRTDDKDDQGWEEFRLRAYTSTETIPDFTSTVYTYWGLRGEGAPKLTSELNFHPSVNTIKEEAFQFCYSLVRVTIPDHVQWIEDEAFRNCVALTFIKLPPNLEFIGYQAFAYCESLEAVFLPPTVTFIGDDAFRNCDLLRHFYLPNTIRYIGMNIVAECYSLLTPVQWTFDDEEVNQLLMTRHANFHLHKVCSSTHVTPHEIEVCFQEHGIERATEQVDDQQMTALHILCLNPRVTGEAIRAYLQLAPEAAANAQDDTGKTGLHILCSLPYQDTCTRDAIRSYLSLAPEAAANVQDCNGMTPVQYLWDSHDGLLEDRNFSTLMTWWYNCMP